MYISVVSSYNILMKNIVIIIYIDITWFSKKKIKTLYNKLFVKATFKSTQVDKNSSTLYDSLSIKNLLTALLNLVPLKFFISAGSLL